jgi:hypothetical protein
MKHARRLAFLVLVSILLLAPLAARAAIIWSWSFDQTEYVVGPSDSIIVHATLLNDLSSTENLQIEGAGANFGGDLQKIYDFTFGPTGNSSEFSTQFFGVDLAPGETSSFVWGILTPIGAVAPGIYPADPAILGLQLPSIGVVEMEPSNTFLVRVVVPEPPAVVLLLTAILGALLFARPIKTAGWPFTHRGTETTADSRGAGLARRDHRRPRADSTFPAELAGRVLEGF